jgi:hypothetical protein
MNYTLDSILHYSAMMCTTTTTTTTTTLEENKLQYCNVAAELIWTEPICFIACQHTTTNGQQSSQSEKSGKSCSSAYDHQINITTIV